MNASAHDAVLPDHGNQHDQHDQHVRPTWPDEYDGYDPFEQLGPPERDDETVEEIDPDFVFDYRPIDDPGADQRFSTYWDVEPLQRGPRPVPDWLVTDRAAIDTELGVLKTGKEADVFLVERAVEDGPSCLLAVKRYRSPEHRTFHRSAVYTEGRTTRRSRDVRALKRKSTFGREVAAGQWAASEWDALKRCWEAGVPVPYPVQVDGTEICMELITPDGRPGPEPAPRLANARPSHELLEQYFEQFRDIVHTLAEHGLAHGDLSPYNVLATADRLVVIDLPQVVDLVGNPQAGDFLMRDCHNMCAWFQRRGLDVDEHALFAEVLVTTFG